MATDGVCILIPALVFLVEAVIANTITLQWQCYFSGCTDVLYKHTIFLNVY